MKVKAHGKEGFVTIGYRKAAVLKDWVLSEYDGTVESTGFEVYALVIEEDSYLLEHSYNLKLKLSNGIYDLVWDLESNPIDQHKISIRLETPPKVEK